MIIVGAGGFAKELLEIEYQNDSTNNLAFYDDINDAIMLYNKYPILKNENEVRKHFKEYGNDFSIGIGKPRLRKSLYHKFISLGGQLKSIISNRAEIGHFGVKIGDGCNILSGVKISNTTTIGKCCLIYYNCIITHDVTIMDFAELSPNVTLLGRCRVGNLAQIGSGAIILPDIIIGNNTIIGAGAVVTRNVPDNTVVAGVPAVKINEIK